jgi:hypothetical protein
MALVALPNIIRYFRDCYEEDNRRSTLWNIFHGSVSHRLFVEDEEALLTGFLVETPLDPDDGSDARTAAYLHQKEKELVYCSLFILGRLSTGEAEPRSICAPVLIHPTEIIEQPPHVFLKPDFETRRLNYHLLDALEGDSGQKTLSRQAADLLTIGPIAAEQVFELSGLLEEAVPGLNADALRQYPKLVPQRDLQSMFSQVKEQVGRLLAVSSSAVALINKSVETRGVVNELSEMAEAEAFSEPLQVLFSASPAQPSARMPRFGRVPAVLNTAQQTIIEQGATSPLTLVIGPPGTGKSFTIAALAVEHLSRQQSVLIASKMNHAVDVIGDKIERQLEIKGCAIRGGRKQYLKDLKQHLDQLLSGMHTGEGDQGPDPHQLEKELKRVDRELERLERLMHRRNTQELTWGRLLSVQRTGVLQTIINSYIDYRVKHLEPLWQLLEKLECLLDRRVHETTRLAQVLNHRRLRESLARHRQQFSTFLRAIRARTGVKQEDLFGQIDFKILLTALPIWLVNLADIQDVLPLKKDLFDLAIIDEATQCDIASCLPVFQRSRRVVISGDPNQLRHMSFLPGSRQRELLARYGIELAQEHRYDYRGRSILDFVNEALPSQEQVVFLDEHYRSLPPIIEFSNKRFYADSLRIMTEKPGKAVLNSLMLCPGEGQRNRLGVNQKEANRLISDCLLQIESEQSLGPESRHSIGILSPFRGQADYIADQLTEALKLAVFEKHDILIGTAHTFQGEERDIVYISLAVDESTHPAALRFLERPDVFNVTITRARVAQRIYTSIDPALLDGGSLLRAYLDHIEASQKEILPSADNALRDCFLSEAEAALKGLGCETWAGYKVAGMMMDLVAARDGRSCGIDLVGYPGAYESAFPLERYKMFHRAGLRIVPLSYALWRTQRDRCLRAIDDALSSGNGKA